MVKNSKAKPKKVSVLSKVKLFFEEIPDNRPLNKRKPVANRTLKRNKRR